MKLLFVALLLTGSIATAYSQGQLVFNTVRGAPAPNGFGAPIYGIDPQAPSVFLQGQGSANLSSPAGVVDYGARAPLAGSGFTAQLWGGLGANTLVAPIDGTGTQRFSDIPALAGHLASGVTARFPFSAGTVLTLQVRAWDNMNGTVTSWAQVLADNTVARGWSLLFQSPVLTVAPGLPQPTPGITSFSLMIPEPVLPIPEPSLLALGALGGALGFGALGLRRVHNRRGA